MAWTVNFKACKRCSSGEYWLVSSGFTNTVHPVSAGSHTHVGTCARACMAWSPWEGGEGFPKSCLPGKTGGRQAKMMICRPGSARLCCGSLSSERASCRGELAACGSGCRTLPPANSSRLPDAVPTRACTSPGPRRVGWIVKETHSAMTSPDAAPVWPASTWWLFSSRCCSR